MAFIRGQQTVHVRTETLISHLKDNKVKHVAEYNAAVEGFKDEMVRVLQEELKKAKQGELKMLSLTLYAPTSHETEYQEAIDMLEFSVDETIQLDTQSFKAYFKDEWDWTGHFKSMVTAYSKSI